MCPTSPREEAKKFADDRAFADPDKAARKLAELANAAEADRGQRIAIELINLPFLRTGASADEYRAGFERAIEKGWLVRHESGTYVKFTQSRADLFARWRADGSAVSPHCPLLTRQLTASSLYWMRVV
jgi:hypothetical protein